MAAPKISAKHFDKYLKFGKTPRPKLREVSCLFISYDIAVLDFIHWIVLEFFLLRDMEINLYAKESLEPYSPLRERVAEYRGTYRERRNSVSVNDVRGTIGESAGTVGDTVSHVA